MFGIDKLEKRVDKLDRRIVELEESNMSLRKELRDRNLIAKHYLSFRFFDVVDVKELEKKYSELIKYLGVEYEDKRVAGFRKAKKKKK